MTHFAKLDIRLLITSYVLNPNHKLEWLTAEAIGVFNRMLVQILLWTKTNVDVPQLKAEKIEYFNAIKMNREFITDLFGWWEEAKWDGFKIAGMRLAACHASSANTERIFSGLNQIATKNRNRLLTKSLFDIMCVRMFALGKDDKAKRVRVRRTEEEEEEELIVSRNEIEVPNVDVLEVQDVNLIENDSLQDILGGQNYRKFCQLFTFVEADSFRQTIPDCPHMPASPVRVNPLDEPGHDLALIEREAENLADDL
jgi:hypothetical protein